MAGWPDVLTGIVVRCLVKALGHVYSDLCESLDGTFSALFSVNCIKMLCFVYTKDFQCPKRNQLKTCIFKFRSHARIKHTHIDVQ